MPGTDVQQEVTKNWIRLWKKSPGQAARQFCLIQVQLDLFGGAALVIEQGCISGSSRRRVEHYTSESAARAAMQDIVRAKKRRGYAV